MERNELEKRLEKESVYDTALEIYNHLSLYEPGMKIHNFGKIKFGFSLMMYILENNEFGLNKEISFQEFKK
jgi:hypothetical protein